MAESTFTQTGVAEMRSAIERFPDAVTARLKATAGAAAQRVRTRAQGLLRGQLKTDATKLADNITVEQDEANKQFLVVSRSPIGQPTNVNLWNEHGTVHMPARPYMRPSAQAEAAQFEREMRSAADAVAAETFGA